MKYIIFDAGPIISMSMNGLLPLIDRLKKECGCQFILTPAVKKEVLDKPMKVKKFKLEAIKVKSLIDKGTLKMSNHFIPDSELLKERNRIMKLMNGVLRSVKTGEKIKIIHEGEADCLAFANLCKSDNLIVVDERSTRMLFESPNDLKSLMERKLHCSLDANFGLISNLDHYKFIRSAELVYIAYKKNLIGFGKSKDVLDALLYGLKFKGTTISSREIDILKSMA